ALIDRIELASAPPQKPPSQRGLGSDEAARAVVASGHVSPVGAPPQHGTAIGIGLPSSTLDVSRSHSSPLEDEKVPVAVARPRMPTAPGLGEVDADGTDIFAAAERALASERQGHNAAQAVREQAARSLALGSPPPKPSSTRHGQVTPTTEAQA